MTPNPPIWLPFCELSGYLEGLLTRPLVAITDQNTRQFHLSIQRCTDTFPLLRQWAANNDGGVIYDKCFNLYRAALRWDGDPLVESNITQARNCLVSFDSYVTGDV